MNILSDLVITAAFLVASGTILLGIVLFLDESIRNLIQKADTQQNLYWEIRRQMDRSTELYEISRIFTSFALVDQKITPNSRDATPHKDSYIAILKQSEISAFNAAYGSTENDEGDIRSKPSPDEAMHQGRSEEQIHKNIRKFIPIANQRCNILIREVRESNNRIKTKTRCKKFTHATGLTLNSIGIVLSAFAQLLDKC